MAFSLNIVLLKILFCTALGETGYTDTCFQCLKHGKIFVRSLWPYSENDTYCVNKSSQLPLSALPIMRACSYSECICADAWPTRVFNKSALCNEVPQVDCLCSYLCNTDANFDEKDFQNNSFVESPNTPLVFLSVLILILVLASCGIWCNDE